MLPLVSIIIPVYNAGNYVKSCLHSALNQRYQNIEILVINNCSTDDSLAHIETIKSDKIRVYHCTIPGACKARNMGLEKAKGTYIQFLDADDLISENKIEAQLASLAGILQHLSICKTQVFWDDEPVEKRPFENLELLFDSDNPVAYLQTLYGKNKAPGMMQTNSWLVPKKVIDKAGNWNENLKQDQDGEYFCRLVLASEGIRVAPDAVNYYRKYRADKSISGNKAVEYKASALEALHLKTKLILKHDQSILTKQILYNLYLNLMVSFYAEHPALYNEALRASKQLVKTSYVPVMGGKTIELIKAAIGWQLTKRLILLNKTLPFKF